MFEPIQYFRKQYQCNFNNIPDSLECDIFHQQTKPLKIST